MGLMSLHSSFAKGCAQKGTEIGDNQHNYELIILIVFNQALASMLCNADAADQLLR